MANAADLTLTIMVKTQDMAAVQKLIANFYETISAPAFDNQDNYSVKVSMRGVTVKMPPPEVA